MFFLLVVVFPPFYCRCFELRTLKLALISILAFLECREFLFLLFFLFLSFIIIIFGFVSMRRWWWWWHLILILAVWWCCSFRYRLIIYVGNNRFLSNFGAWNLEPSMLPLPLDWFNWFHKFLLQNTVSCIMVFEFWGTYLLNVPVVAIIFFFFNIFSLTVNANN